jgi:outer membrane protein OmpA-like peptidoglycan-associated protein
VKKKKPTAVPEEKGECAPLWIISFADMISLLMAFFVMLLTMTTSKSSKLCNEGDGIFERTVNGFRRSIEGFGVPGLFAGTSGLYGAADDSLYFDGSKTYYPISDGNDPNATRTIDASEERMQRILLRLDRRTKTYKSQIQGQHPNFVVVPVTFDRGQFVLDEPAKRFLSKFAEDLQGLSAVQKLNLYVVGLASQEADEKQQWIVSARRAQAVADFLKDSLPSEIKLPIYSWGACAGSDWVGKDSPISDQVEIMIAVLRADQ